MIELRPATTARQLETWAEVKSAVVPNEPVTAQLATVLRTVSTALAWGPETEYVVTYK